ncbi:tetratricopeptide (TPR) repeat protein [Dysgonomonas hofstadii]|uniref:Tetratricopeptide (TPR) repeat protein n=1 Tax=Dysgonomonas hofstadii TaxID=637886 RepID=A0A840CPV7_9BACT|nr:tetratricopeptide repeat protein [Dysgonomonas hofstadii]MBB4036118.1 tetratricopeptide (TPR) repeat protein [Dysgonomonas hofstadii]
MVKIYSSLTYHKFTYALLIPLLVVLSSCGLFDKELKQDEHISHFRHQIARVVDSLDTSKERIVAFKTIIEDINEDNALITPRKKNLLLIEGHTYISNEYLDAKNYKKAMEYTNKIIEIDSTSPRGYYSRGCVYQATNKDSLAILDYSKALSLSSGYADAYYNRALLYEEKKDYDLALSDLNKAAKLNPPYLRDIYYNRGEIYKTKESYDKAIAEYNKVIDLDTLNIMAYCNRGDSYFLLKNLDKAILDYNKSILLDSANVHLYLKRATAFEVRKDYNDAINDYKKILRLDPNNRYDYYSEAKKAIKKLKPLVKD